MMDSELISNRYRHIWVCNRLLDGETIQLQNGEGQSDVHISPNMPVINLYSNPSDMHNLPALPVYTPNSSGPKHFEEC